MNVSATKKSKLDLIVNFVTILTGLSIIAFLGWRFTTERRAEASSPQIASYETGERMELPGVDFGTSTKTLVMFMSSQCRFCTDSMPFYRRLSPLRSHGVRLLAVSAESQAILQDYLRQHELNVDGLVGIRPGSMKVKGTPTLVLVDNKGTVTNVWHGRLPETGEAEVIHSLEGRSPERSDTQ